MLSRRALLFGGLAAASWAALAKPARAMIARALTLSELVAQSQHALVATPLDLSSTWESVGGRSRVVTYARVRTEYSIDGRASASPELMVRSLGGVVGHIGQIVPGEAILRRGATAVLFLQAINPDVFCVTAMSQGHYPVFSDSKGVRRVRANPAAAEVFGPNAAVRLLDQRTLGEVETLVFDAFTRGTP